MLSDPITDIAKQITKSREYGMTPSVVKMQEKTLRELFESEEGRDIASRYAPTVDTLAKTLSGMVNARIRVEIEPAAAPDKVYIQS